jgi:SAM-dependent methyltransferase
MGDIAGYRKFSMLTPPRLIHLKEEVSKFSSNEDVCFVECGVAKGGALCLIANHANPKSKVYGFDSFEKMPNLTDQDENEDRALRNNFVRQNGKYVGRKFAGENDVINAFKKLNISMDNVELVKGFIQDTLPKHLDNIQNIAVLHLDVDFYEATKCALEQLYDKVIPGGVIIIDDYDAYIGCRHAVTDFRPSRHIVDKIHRTKEFIPGRPQGVERWWIKQS